MPTTCCIRRVCAGCSTTSNQRQPTSSPHTASSNGSTQPARSDSPAICRGIPTCLVHGAFIDAMAMFRRSSWLELGGYSTADGLYGWEDYDLWLTVAERGQRADLVRSIIGRSPRAAWLDAQDQRCRHGIEFRHTPRTTSEVAMAELDTRHRTRVARANPRARRRSSRHAPRPSSGSAHNWPNCAATARP